MPGHVIIETGILEDLGDGRTKSSTSRCSIRAKSATECCSGNGGWAQRELRGLDKLLAKLA